MEWLSKGGQTEVGEVGSMLRKDERYHGTRMLLIGLMAVLLITGFTALLARDTAAGSADLDENGFVNSEDLLLFQQHTNFYCYQYQLQIYYLEESSSFPVC